MRKEKNVNLAEKRFVMPEDVRLPGACCDEKDKREVKNETWHQILTLIHRKVEASGLWIHGWLGLSMKEKEKKRK